ncbi:MAG: GNAT family N-acetyltransferase [Planctomycetota bacterium]
MPEDATIDIRSIRPDDYPAIVRLWEAAGLSTRPAGRDAEPAFQKQLPHFPTTYLVAEHEGRIVGVILGTHDQRKGWINRLAVHPQWRRRGVALQLIEACEEAFEELGIGIVAALIERGNDYSVEFFRAAGYVTDVPVHYFVKRAAPGV